MAPARYLSWLESCPDTPRLWVCPQLGHIKAAANELHKQVEQQKSMFLSLPLSSPSLPPRLSPQ